MKFTLSRVTLKIGVMSALLFSALGLHTTLHPAHAGDEKTVFFNAWGGSPVINDYIIWASKRLEEDHGIAINHVKLTDTATAVSRILAEKTVGRNEGGSVDLIGHNGAGTSTFLRLVSGIYRHTSGRFNASVSVFPMIHKRFITSSELSGLQAVKAHYLLVHGHLNGFEEFFDDVVEFSGLGDFVHLPLKTYSQGMSARLLFAVLTGGHHDCLAMDEGFGAGDNSFYEKAEERMDRFLRSAGTLLLASHSEDLLRRFCGRGLVFDSGRLVFSGPLEHALSYYHEYHAPPAKSKVR